MRHIAFLFTEHIPKQINVSYCQIRGKKAIVPRKLRIATNKDDESDRSGTKATSTRKRKTK